MKRHLRQAIYFLLLTFVSNTIGWTFNQEAVADVLFEEQRSLAMNVEHTADQHDESNAIQPQQTCNHWCQAVAHFMGLPSQSTFLIPEYFGEYTAPPLVTLQLYSPDDLFRPPRATLA